MIMTRQECFIEMSKTVCDSIRVIGSDGNYSTTEMWSTKTFFTVDDYDNINNIMIFWFDLILDLI